ncbi:Hypothetical predicted protein [Podarcis lilfordi]|uniref:Uncharacterized protein n=1 Tax=Podarcis lilfordi TaxID=74358 RepID=A0AA35NVV0_9SAUR|nr:Hypothetical predicted protein [Podarcis lilfordi]
MSERRRPRARRRFTALTECERKRKHDSVHKYSEGRHGRATVTGTSRGGRLSEPTEEKMMGSRSGSEVVKCERPDSFVIAKCGEHWKRNDN